MNPPSSPPDWLDPVVRALEEIDGADLSALGPPEDANPRPSAVLMLFGEGEHGPDLLLTERSHTMRSHPGQVSFPGGSLEAGESAVQAALRESEEETGLVTEEVEVLGELPRLWLPPSNFAVSPVVGWWRGGGTVEIRSPEEVHAIYRIPIAELCDPAYRIQVVSPRLGFTTPGFWMGPEKNVILWGFTGGLIYRFFRYLGWLEDVQDPPVVELPEYMLAGRERTPD